VHIALDGSDLASAKLDGTTVYVRELLPRLAKILKQGGHRVTVFSHSPIAPNVFGDDVKINITKGRRFWTQTVLSRVLFRVKPDLLFLPIQTVPLYRPAALKVVATIHDLDFLEYPKMYEWKNQLLLRWFSRVVARNATRLIAITNSTKHAIIKYYQRAAEDISVVHHGFDKKNFSLPVSEEEKERVLTNLRNKYNIKDNSILFVGGLQPKKNVGRLIDAFEILKNRGHQVQLVIVSGYAWKEKNVLDKIAHSDHREDIRVLRKVPYCDLAGFYWNSLVSVLPSVAEGFGLPILEAMACGTPVVTSNLSAMPEVAGGAALLIDPQLTDSLVQGLEKILTDEQTRLKYINLGLARVADFSWDKCAEETANAINRALNKETVTIQ
jgi:glycosyltransferase involved in cell wall biosynthesis